MKAEGSVVTAEGRVPLVGNEDQVRWYNTVNRGSLFINRK